MDFFDLLYGCCIITHSMRSKKKRWAEGSSLDHLVSRLSLHPTVFSPLPSTCLLLHPWAPPVGSWLNGDKEAALAHAASRRWSLAAHGGGPLGILLLLCIFTHFPTSWPTLSLYLERNLMPLFLSFSKGGLWYLLVSFCFKTGYIFRTVLDSQQN